MGQQCGSCLTENVGCEQWKTTNLSKRNDRMTLMRGSHGFPIASEDWNKNHYQAGAMKLAVVGLCLSPAVQTSW